MVKCLITVNAVVVGCLLFACFPAEAQPPRAEDKWDYGIWIYSPQNTTYTQNALLLNVTAKRYVSPTYYVTVLKYCINGGENTSIPTTGSFVQNPPVGIYGDIASYTLLRGTAILPELPQGKYTLTVYADYTRKESIDPKWPNMHDAKTIDFTINNGIPPAITLLPPETVTTKNRNLTLTLIVDKPISRMGYSLDGQDNVTVTGNFTIPKLTAGMHNVTVYAEDPLGNMGSSETASFKVSEPEQTEPCFLKVLAITTTVLFIGATLLYYKESLLKRKQATIK